MKMSSKFTCRFCKEQFDQPKGLYKHLQSAHSAGASTDNRTCPICGVLCSKYEGYRDHLLYIHGQSSEGQKLTFKSLNEFLLWKTELEIKYNCKYVLQSAPKVLSTKEKKYFYQCDASIPKPKEKKSLSVVMKQCSSVISVVEGTGVFKVEYWDAHSGHAESVQLSVQNELEAAISSVEMVNAIGESDDSLDRSEEFPMSPTQSTFEIRTAIEKPPFLKAGNANATATLVTPKSKTLQLAPKPDAAKKKSTNMLFSLASVACGKGISKKAGDKLNASKKDTNNTSVNTLKVPVKSDTEKVNMTLTSPMKNKNGTITLLSTPAKPPVQPTTTTASSVKSILSSSDTVKSRTSSDTVKSRTLLAKSAPTLKVTSSGPQAIAPKITTINSSSMNTLFTTNSAFPNQLVIVNPAGQNPNSSQNVTPAGQNIVLSLPFGQSILSAAPTSQADNKPAATASSTKTAAFAKVATSPANAPNVSKSIVKSAGGNKVVSNGTSSTTTTITPISLSAGIKNAPVVLNSLPIGSTFMSVNNSLIPIATPSGNFLPTSLPPNIVLTPIVSTMSSTQPTSQSTSVSSQIVQNQVCFSVPCTPSVTISSVRREPIYSSTPMKSINNSIITPSSISPIFSTSPKSYKATNDKGIRNKTKALTVSKILSPIKSTKLSSGAVANAVVPILNKFAASGELSITPTTVQKNSATKAKKRAVKSILKPAIVSSTVKNTADMTVRNTVKNTVDMTVRNTVKSTVATNLRNVVTTTANSQFSLPPIGSIPNITIPTQRLNNLNMGTVLFESSGEVFMLEPIENNTVQNFAPVKSTVPAPTLKIDKYVQTFENTNLSTPMPKLQRKRTADSDDDAVMMKVKCYQLEMKYLSSQTDCKRLKLELTKEKLKNAELTGESIDIKHEGSVDEARSKASEIMKEIEDKYSKNKDTHIYTMTKTSVLRGLYEDLEDLCIENSELHKELESYRAHDKFYKSLKRKLYDEDFES